jgi:hypothetical protein
MVEITPSTHLPTKALLLVIPVFETRGLVDAFPLPGPPLDVGVEIRLDVANPSKDAMTPPIVTVNVGPTLIITSVVPDTTVVLLGNEASERDALRVMAVGLPRIIEAGNVLGDIGLDRAEEGSMTGSCEGVVEGALTGPCDGSAIVFACYGDTA